MPALLDVRNLNIEFAAAPGRVTAVRDVSFHIDPGEVLGLVGESGSGKSVSALAVLRLLPPQARVRGNIYFRGTDLLGISEPEMRQIRGAGISMIFQEPMTALNPVMRVGDQIAEAVLAHAGAKAPDIRAQRDAALKGRSTDDARFTEDGRSTKDGRFIDDGRSTDYARSTEDGRSIDDARFTDDGRSIEDGRSTTTARSTTKAEAWRLAVEALRIVAIADADRRARDYPHQLSGGQRQRVMIAMAVVNRPALLIADEPTTALDVTIQAQVLDLLSDLREKFSLAMLFISHDLAVVSQVAHRIGVMYAGNLVEMGTADEVFRKAVHPYTRGLLNSVPTLRTARSKPLPTIEGAVPVITAPPPGCAFEPRCPSRIASCAAELPPLVEVTPGHFARCPVVAREVG